MNRDGMDSWQYQIMKKKFERIFSLGTFLLFPVLLSGFLPGSQETRENADLFSAGESVSASPTLISPTASSTEEASAASGAGTVQSTNTPPTSFTPEGTLEEKVTPASTLTFTSTPESTPGSTPTPADVTNTPSPSPEKASRTPDRPSSTVSPTLNLEPSDTPFPRTPTPDQLVGSYLPQEAVIHVQDIHGLDRLKKDLKVFEVEVMAELTELQAVRVKVTGMGLGDFLEQVAQWSYVEYAEPNYLVQSLGTIPSDPYFDRQYGLEAVKAPEAWDYSTGSNLVTLAVIDTGVDLDHPDLAAKIVSGVDIANGDQIPNDDHGHGTYVAGVAAAVSNNGLGVAGVSWGARLMPVKVLDQAGNGSYADLAAGIIWAVDHGAQVINLSLGGYSPSQVLLDAVEFADQQGVIQVAAAGNTGSGSILYPARYAQVLAVGATNELDQRAPYSNYGPEIVLVAPGTGIYTTALGGGYGGNTGTSMAVPYVSGLASLLVGMPRPYSPAQIAYEMESTALDLGPTGRDAYYGYGLIQMDDALELARPTSTPTPTLTWAPTAAPTNTPRPTSAVVVFPTHTPLSTAEPVESTPELTAVPEEPAGTEDGLSSAESTPSPTLLRATSETRTPTVLSSSTSDPQPEVSIQGGGPADAPDNGRRGPVWMLCMGGFLLLVGGGGMVTLLINRYARGMGNG